MLATMPAYTFYLVEAGLGISDTPLAYTTPKGPRIEFGLTYNQRDANQPQTFTYTNWGPKWTSAWVSYLIPSQTSTAIKHYRAGGGQLTSAWIPIPTTGTAQPRVERLPDSGAVIYHPNGKQQTLDSKTVKAMKDQGKSLPGATNPRLAMQERVLTQSMGLVARPGDWIESRTNEFIRRNSGSGYALYKPDGSTEIYDKSDGATPAKFFLSSRVDPSGNAVSIAYDATMRITSTKASPQPKEPDIFGQVPKNLLASIVANLALVTGWMVWVGWKVQQSYYGEFGLPVSIEEPTVLGTVVRSIGALANIGWVWFFITSVLVGVTLVIVHALRRDMSKKWWANWIVRGVLGYFLWLAWVGMGSGLGQYYGQQAARTRKDSPKAYELVSFRIRPEQENQFSPALIEKAKQGELIRIFQNKDLLVVLPKGSKRTYTIQTKDLVEVSSSLSEGRDPASGN